MPDTLSPAEPATDEAVENGEDGPVTNGSIANGPGASEQAATEYGGPKGREPTRYGDWEKNGRCIDF